MCIRDRQAIVISSTVVSIGTTNCLIQLRMVHVAARSVLTPIANDDERRPESRVTLQRVGENLHLGAAHRFGFAHGTGRVQFTIENGHQGRGGLIVCEPQRTQRAARPGANGNTG